MSAGMQERPAGEIAGRLARATRAVVAAAQT